MSEHLGEVHLPPQPNAGGGKPFKPLHDLAPSRGVGRLEKTEVAFRIGGEPLSIMRLVVETQSETTYGGPLAVGSLQMKPERAKSDELRVDVVFWICRLHQVEEEEES